MIGIGTDFANLSGERSYSLSYYTKGRTSILSYREYRVSWVASFPVGRRKLPDRECFVTTFRQGGYTPLRRLCGYPSPVYLPSAASKLQKKYDGGTQFEKSCKNSFDRSLLRLDFVIP